MIRSSTICAPREPCLCECTWLHLVSYPVRWSFSFILGPLQSSSIYFQHPECTDIHCSSFVHGCTLRMCVSYLQVDAGAVCDQGQCSSHLAQCLWDQARSPIVVSVGVAGKYTQIQKAEMQISRNANTACMIKCSVVVGGFSGGSRWQQLSQQSRKVRAAAS